MGSLISLNQTSLEQKFINESIKSSDIVLFSKTTCFYCDQAKELLTKSNLKFRSIELDKNENCPENNCSNVIKSLVEFTRFKTVPQIFINGVFIGGYSDLVKLIDKIKN